MVTASYQILLLIKNSNYKTEIRKSIVILLGQILIQYVYL